MECVTLDKVFPYLTDYVWGFTSLSAIFGIILVLAHML